MDVGAVAAGLEQRETYRVLAGQEGATSEAVAVVGDPIILPVAFDVEVVGPGPSRSLTRWRAARLMRAYDLLYNCRWCQRTIFDATTVVTLGRQCCRRVPAGSQRDPLGGIRLLRLYSRQHYVTCNSANCNASRRRPSLRTTRGEAISARLPLVSKLNARLSSGRRRTPVTRVGGV
jgi:hypothetical protein